MSQQVINVGAAPNDGAGDPIRTAYIKCNDNFSELYTRAQTTPPTTLVGKIGDQAGMYAYDVNFWYYCYADYDGSSTIWAEVAQVGNIAVSAIESGNSSAAFDDIGGNLVIAVHGTSNVAVFRNTGFYTSANVTANNVNATKFYGTVATAAQTSITSVGTLTALNLSGTLTSSANISTSGNVIGGNIVSPLLYSSGNVSAAGNVNAENIIAVSTLSTPGIISATGNIVTSGYFVGTFAGNITGNFVVPGSDTQVIFNTAGNADASANFTFNKTSNVLQVTGNVSTINVLSTTVSAAGNITGGNLRTAGTISATGNITGGNVLFGAGQISGTGDATVGNISATSHVGSVVSVTANITGGNLRTAGTISASGNVTGGNVVGGGVSAVSNVTGANLNVTTACVTGNVTGGNILTSGLISAASTITSGANITGGNILTGGLVSATGNVAGNYILGNGVFLSGVITSVANINNGTSNVSINSANANVAVNVNGTANVAVFASSGEYITGLMSVSGNVTGGNILTSGQISATANVTGGNLIAGTNVSATSLVGSVVSVSGNITGGNLSVGNGTVSLNNIVNNGANTTGNIGSSTTYFNQVFAQATTALYADLAEKYTSDAVYEPGTVVVIGGTAEVTQSSIDQDRAVAGVVSTQPAVTMNSGLEGTNTVTVALIGRVPCKVQGTIHKGDLLVSTTHGRARAENDPKLGAVIGKALESFDGDQGVIEIIVGKL